ncbi:MAG: cobalt ECF transporter T component CbiQ [Gammaproteobacteria bacterium]
MEFSADRLSVLSEETYLRRLDGRIKTCVFLAAIVIVSILTKWHCAASALLVALTLIATLRLPWRKVLWRMAGPFGIAWLVLASLVFTTGHTVVATISFWHVSVPVYREGMALGFLIMLRILAAVSFAMLLSFSTPMVEILATLRLAKVPGLILDIADMVYRYAFLLRDTSATMRKAQRARGGEGLPWRQQARDVGMVAGNLLIKAFNRSVGIYKAMLARGYDEDAQMLPYFSRPVPTKDFLIGISAGLILLALLISNFAVA